MIATKKPHRDAVPFGKSTNKEEKKHGDEALKSNNLSTKDSSYRLN
jgi:hypothetical protein